MKLIHSRFRADGDDSHRVPKAFEFPAKEGRLDGNPTQPLLTADDNKDSHAESLLYWTAPPMIDLLLARRSVGRVLPDQPPRATIERLLEAACAAPNHHHTQPWRFIVISGTAREEVGKHLRAALQSRLSDPASAPAQALLQKEEAKLLRAPVVIVVAVHPSTGPGVFREEEIASGAAACQNMLLAAEAQGLGAMWRTGETAYEPAVLDALGLEPQDSIVGFIYVGYPDPANPPSPRPPRRSWREMTRWWGWDE
jgi:nitroreductase